MIGLLFRFSWPMYFPSIVNVVDSYEFVGRFLGFWCIQQFNLHFEVSKFLTFLASMVQLWFLKLAYLCNSFGILSTNSENICSCLFSSFFFFVL